MKAERLPAEAVVWIASYPKSGNTWVQTVIRRAGQPFGFPNGDLDVYKMIREGRQPEVVGGIRPEVTGARATVLKTHSRYTPKREPHFQLQLKSAGFVYVMRNPLDMLLSYINFTRLQYEKRRDSSEYRQTLFLDLLGFDGPLPYEAWLEHTLERIPRANLDHALERFTELGTAIPGVGNAGGSWLEHCRSWRKAGRSLPGVFLRYEDLLAGPQAFMPLTRLFAFSEAQIASAVAAVNERQRAEQFKKVFFNKMSAYYYPEFFSPGVLARFLSRFEGELRELGYENLPRTA
jgi:hypothetical protein